VSASGADVFARLAAEGSDALHRGDARTAVERLAAALRTRGPEEDVDVRADLAEAQLRLGRHRDVVPELRQLVAHHPERERLRRQLAVALARSGRRSEALAVCTEAPAGPLLTRLQRSIERREPLDVESARAPRARVRPRAVRPVLAGAVVAAALGLTAAILLRDGGGDGSERGAVVVRTPTPVRPLPATPVAEPSEPLPYATDRGALWSSSPDRTSVVLLGADSRRQRAVAVAGHVDALAAGNGSLWVADTDAERLLRLSQRTGRVTGSVRMPRGILGRPGSAAVAVAGETVWATNGGPLLRLDGKSGRVLGRLGLDGPTALVADAGGAWVGTRTGDLVRASPRGARTAASRFPGVPGRVVRLVLAHGSLWVARGEPGDATLWRYETSPAAIYGTPVPGRFTADIVARDDAMWARLPSTAYARIDARTNAVLQVDREVRSATVR
jgi:hypothetical protein